MGNTQPLLSSNMVRLDVFTAANGVVCMLSLATIPVLPDAAQSVDSHMRQVVFRPVSATRSLYPCLFEKSDHSHPLSIYLHLHLLVPQAFVPLAGF